MSVEVAQFCSWVDSMYPWAPSQPNPSMGLFIQRVCSFLDNMKIPHEAGHSLSPFTIDVAVPADLNINVGRDTDSLTSSSSEISYANFEDFDKIAAQEVLKLLDSILPKQYEGTASSIPAKFRGTAIFIVESPQSLCLTELEESSQEEPGFVPLLAGKKSYDRIRERILSIMGWKVAYVPVAQWRGLNPIGTSSDDLSQHREL